MTVSPDQIAKAKQHLTNVEALAAACDKTGLPFFLAATILQKETGGANVFGHDRGGAMAGAGEVTEAKYREFRKLIDAGHTSNGIGPCQITWKGYFPEMERLGLRPWIPADNILFGCQILVKTWNATHSTYQVGKSYNGGAAYGTATETLAAVWRQRVGTDDTSPQLPPYYVQGPPLVTTGVHPVDSAGNTMDAVLRPPGFAITTGVRIVHQWGHDWLLTKAGRLYRLDYLTKTPPTVGG